MFGPIASCESGLESRLSKVASSAKLKWVMSEFLLGALSLLLSTNPPAAVSNLVVDRLAPFAALGGAPTVDPHDPTEIEFQEVLRRDDLGEAEIERIATVGPAPDPARSPSPDATREAGRVQLLSVINQTRARYEEFLKKHPEHVRAHLAYADHLEEHGDDNEVLEHLGIALKLDPKNPAGWNNYAHHYTHVGPITNAFHAYEQAIAFRPFEPVYHYNYGTVVFLYRKDAKEYFHCDENAVFERALSEYRECRRLAPRDFRYAFDYAQTFYGVKPEPASTPEGWKAAELRLAERAIQAWRDALAVANNETDREGVFIHFARWQIKLGRWDEARASLAEVTRPEHAELKARLERSLLRKETGGDDLLPAPRTPIETPRLLPN